MKYSGHSCMSVGALPGDVISCEAFPSMNLTVRPLKARSGLYGCIPELGPGGEYNDGM
jgi:hypothetical protein